MKILDSRGDYTDGINPGRFSFIINIDARGAEIDIDELVKQAIHFPRITIKGFEPFEQREDIAKFIRKVIKHNPNIIIDIHTQAFIRPVSIGNYDNVIYNVELQLKNSGKDYKERIKDEVISWFNTMSANFIFKIKNQDDIDESEMLVHNHGISKYQVFLMPSEEIVEAETELDVMKIILVNAKKKGYNFVFNIYDIILKSLEVEKDEIYTRE